MRTLTKGNKAPYQLACKVTSPFEAYGQYFQSGQALTFPTFEEREEFRDLANLYDGAVKLYTIDNSQSIL